MIKREECVFAGFRREVDENWTLLGYYAASSGRFLLTFRDNLSIPSSRVESDALFACLPSLTLGVETIDCPEASVRNHHNS
jgi:hypothetical protein